MQDQSNDIVCEHCQKGMELNTLRDFFKGIVRDGPLFTIVGNRGGTLRMLKCPQCPNPLSVRILKLVFGDKMVETQLRALPIGQLLSDESLQDGEEDGQWILVQVLNR